jgi:hypothetical protein
MVEKVVKDENLAAEVEYSTDISRIVELGVMHSPVLVVDGKPVDLKSISEKDIKAALCAKTEKSTKDAAGCSCGGGC